jgi:predicted transcriptional regulator
MYKTRFGMVSGIVLRNPDISIRAKGLYSYLSTFIDKKGETFVSVEKMAEENDISVSTVKRLLAELKEKQVIQRISNIKSTTITKFV